jgi:phosphoribosylanthranilate isomerase
MLDFGGPRRTRIKFCGMTRLDDALQATALGADAIGLIFAARSKRRLFLEAAASIRDGLPSSVDAVALFMGNSADDVHATIERVRPTVLQFHGDEDDAFCASFGLPYMKAIAMGGERSPNPADVLTRWPGATAFLFDGHAKGEAGGSGQTFDWARMPNDVSRPCLVAGGLTPENVFSAIRAAACWGVDVSSGVESSPGIKDVTKMRRFVEEVRRADGIL